MPWVVPVCVYRESKPIEETHACWEFDRVVDMTCAGGDWPSTLTLSTVWSVRRVLLEHAPFAVLSDRTGRWTRMIAAAGSETDWQSGVQVCCAPSTQYHLEAMAVMVHHNTRIVYYAMNGLSGRLHLAGEGAMLSDIVCMPRRLRRCSIAALQRARMYSVRKQERDLRLVVELVKGRVATYTSTPSFVCVDSLRSFGSDKNKSDNTTIDEAI